MLIGYNNDVDHRGKTFHIQTEDRGANDHRIETQLFHGGAILDTKITSYEEHVEGLEGKARNSKIKSIMKASHRSLFRKLLAGKYDEMVGLDPVEKPEDVVEEKAEQFSPGQDRVPQAAVELEKDGIDALEEEAREEGFEDPAGQDHVDLSQLKDKLAGLKKKKKESSQAQEAAEDIEEVEDLTLGDEDAGESEEDGAQTQVMSAPPEVGEEADSTFFGGDTQRLDGDDVFPEGITPMSEAEASLGVEGVRAWRGCEEPNEDLSLTELVEASLG